MFELQIGADEPRVERVCVGVDAEHAVGSQLSQDGHAVVEQLLGDHFLVQAGAVRRALFGRPAHVRVAQRNAHHQVLTRGAQHVCGQVCGRFAIGQVGEQDHQRAAQIPLAEEVEGAAMVRLDRLGAQVVERLHGGQQSAPPALGWHKGAHVVGVGQQGDAVAAHTCDVGEQQCRIERVVQLGQARFGVFFVRLAFRQR